MSEAEVKTVTGVCVEISERNGWTSFEIDHGGQYTTKVSTKLQPLVELGRAAGSNLATWTYKESDGKENPHKPGTFYKNRYLEKVEVGGSAETGDSESDQNATASPSQPAQAATSQTPVQPGGIRPGGTAQPGLVGREKDIAIARMAALRTAAHLYGAVLGGTPDDDTANDVAFFKVLETANRLVRFVYRDTALDEGIPF